MAGLLFGDAPQYVTPNGAAVAAASGRGLLGLFPGTPEYVAAPTAQLPTTSAPMVSAATVVAPGTAPGIEIKVAIPGLLNLQGSLSIPPWLPEMAPVLVPVLLNVGRRWLELRMCEAAEAAGERAGTSVPRDDVPDADVEG